MSPEPIVVVGYDPDWPTTFAQLRDRAAEALGEVVISIEHIGSTSVPGLAAKPIIDLVVIVTAADVPIAIQRLVRIGYEHRGPLGVEGRDAFRAPNGDPAHHLYVSPTESKELRAQLAFRDRLRSDADLAVRYAALKCELAVRYRNDRMAYTEAKTDFVVAYSQPTEGRAERTVRGSS